MLPALSLLLASLSVQVPSERAQATADFVVERYGDSAIALMGEFVGYETYAHPDGSGVDHPAFAGMTEHLKRVAQVFGFELEDHGAVVVLSLGDSTDRLGLVTHGDVQPADPSKWTQNPFELDVTSEPGLLIGRGTEDDKGPIACALYAMRAIRERGLPLKRRIELIISYTEESDWDPFLEFLQEHPAPPINVAFDAQYPVVVAEKGWCSVQVSVPVDSERASHDGPTLSSFTGGAFLTQVPEGAEAVIVGCTPELQQRLRKDAASDTEVKWTFETSSIGLIVRALGTSAHSSNPQDGVNGITHLAAVLGKHEWPPTAAAQMLRFVEDRVGTGFYAERFGDVAYEDDFMGKLTLSLGTLKIEDGRLICSINLRRPTGRDQEHVERTIQEALDSWQAESGVTLAVETYVGQPHVTSDAEHILILMDTFRFYTGIEDAEPVSSGGGTHARLVPKGVNFGPSMPGTVYTGHTEHEFLSREQFLLNLKMYTSLIVDLATE